MHTPRREIALLLPPCTVAAGAAAVPFYQPILHAALCRVGPLGPDDEATAVAWLNAGAARVVFRCSTKSELAAVTRIGAKLRGRVVVSMQVCLLCQPC